MSNFSRINRFIEYEKNQGRHWQRADMSTLYLTNAVDRTRPPYPILWFMQDMNGNPLCIRYDTAHNMGFVLYDNGIWSPHNVNARDMRSAIQSIQQFWH